MVTWDMWYIDEGFLIWIISLTYLSRESIIWACTTSFVHTYIYRMFNLFTACTYALHTAFYAYFQFQIYCRSFNFPYVICYYLYLHTWTTSLDHVHVCLLCTPFGFIYVLAGCIWQPWILMSRSWSLDHGDLAVADQITQRILDWLSRPLLLLVSTSQLLLCISLRIMYFCIFWWCNIPVI